MKFLTPTVLSFVALSLFLFGLTVLPISNSHAQVVAQNDYIASVGCRSCHQEQYEIWAKGPHAGAMNRLSQTQKRESRCLSCHSTQSSDGLSEGIGCESCHGPGRYYAKSHIMRDPVLREKLFFKEANQATCGQCHDGSAPSLVPFDYEKALERIRHWDDVKSSR